LLGRKVYEKPAKRVSKSGSLEILEMSDITRTKKILIYKTC